MNEKISVLANVKNLKWWQATIMIVSILLAAGFAASQGVVVFVNIDTSQVLTALNLEVGSTYSLLIRDYSYFIATPLGDAAK